MARANDQVVPGASDEDMRRALHVLAGMVISEFDTGSGWSVAQMADTWGTSGEGAAEDAAAVARVFGDPDPASLP